VAVHRPVPLHLLPERHDLLRQADQERLVGRFWDCLEPGGVLFTGHSESLTGVAHRFRYVEPTIYAKA
jgi:chemotaxis methyl-accepting protein methylase